MAGGARSEALRRPGEALRTKLAARSAEKGRSLVQPRAPHSPRQPLSLPPPPPPPLCSP